MKKIMKKALSLLLTLVMVLTFAPMSANAAEGDAVPVPSYEYCIASGDQVTVGANETVYFEIGGGPIGTYDFVVTGEGAFDVSVCTEDGEGAYKEGAAIVATDGKVETEITLYESTYNYCAFSVTNNTDAEAVYECTIVFPEGTQANPKAISLAVGGSATVTVPAESEYYVGATLPQLQVEYALTITGETGFAYSGGYGMPAPDMNGVYETTIAAWYGSATFAIINNTTSEQIYTISLAELPLGSSAKPDEFVVDTTVSKELASSDYWYQWMPEEAGKLTFTVDETACANGWVISVMNDYTGDIIQKSNVWEDSNEFGITFDSYELIKVCISVPGVNELGELDAYVFDDGVVEFSTTYTAGTTDEGGEGGNEGEEPGSEVDTTGEEVNENYFFNYTELGEGTVTVFPEFGYQTTLYLFKADKAGAYTITLSDTSGTVGYYGSNEWFPYDFSQDTGVANTSTYTLNYTQAGAPALIGISDTIMTDVIITWSGEAVEEDKYETIDWELLVSPEDYVFEGEEEDLKQMIYGMADGEVVYVVDDAGYFHVAPVEDVVENEESLFGFLYVGDKKIEDLPYVLADLNDTVVSIEAYLAERDFNAAIYDEDGEVTEVINFTSALNEILACSDEETGLYPLSMDLFVVFALGGESQGWYMNTDTTTGIVAASYPESDGVDPVFLHTFAMYYLEKTEGEDTTPDETPGTTPDETPDTTPTPGTKDPVKTGDSANVVLWFAIFGLGVVAAVAGMKRKNA